MPILSNPFLLEIELYSNLMRIFIQGNVVMEKGSTGLLNTYATTAGLGVNERKQQYIFWLHLLYLNILDSTICHQSMPYIDE